MNTQTPVNFERYVRLALSHARFTRNEDGTWTAEVPLLRGCITWGQTRSEAVEMLKDAIEAWVFTAVRFGDEIPAIDGCVLHHATLHPQDAKVESGSSG